MSRIETSISELTVPDPYSIDTLADVSGDVYRTLQLLAEADHDLRNLDGLNEVAALEKIEVMHGYGRVFVERDTDDDLIRGALHGVMQEHSGMYDVELLAVDAAYRKQGIGRELLNHAERSAREYGASALMLYAINSPGVQAFYIREGFQHTSEPKQDDKFVAMKRVL